MKPTFYFSVPQGDRTGGPECVHQLADAVARRGYRAVMIPMRNFRGRTPDPEYDIYQYETTERILDPDNAILVIGEVSPIESARELRQIPQERTWMWWLSVHNNPDPRARYFRGSSACCDFTPSHVRPPHDTLPAPDPAARVVRRTHYANSTYTGLTWEAWVRTHASYSPNTSLRAFATEAVSLAYNRRVIESDIGFLAQSVYAQGFCRSILGRAALPMTDYLRRPDLVRPDVVPNLVTYNGAKGYSKVGEVAALLPGVKFLPLQGMSYLEVCRALTSSAAYVELGVAPGRDRLPREAAHFGTPSVLLCRGSLYCWDDFPMPAQFRIADTDGWAERTATALADVLSDRPRALREQEDFRTWVAGDRDRYEREVEAWISQAITR